MAGKVKLFGKKRPELLFFILLFAALISKLAFLSLGPFRDDKAFLYLTPHLAAILKFSITGEYFRPLTNLIIYFFVDILKSYFLLRIFNLIIFLSTAYLILKSIGETRRRAFLLLFLSTPVFLDNFQMAVGTGDFLYIFFGVLCYTFLKRENYIYSGIILLLALLSKEAAILFLIMYLIIFRNKKRAVLWLLSGFALYVIIHMSYFKPVVTASVILAIKYFFFLFITGIYLAALPLIPTIDPVNFILNFSNIYTTLLFLTTSFLIIFFLIKKLKKMDRALLILVIILYSVTLFGFYLLRINPIFSYRNIAVIHFLLIILISGNLKKEIIYIISALFILDSFFVFYISHNEKRYYAYNLKIVTQSPSILYANGLEYYADANYDSAVYFLSKALMYSQRNYKIRTHLIDALKKDNRMTEAHKVATPLEKMWVQEKDYVKLGTLYEGIADYRAIQYYKKAKAYKKLGFLYLKENEEDSAAMAFEKYTKDNADSGVMLKLSYIYIKNKKLKKAMRVLTQLLNNEPDNVDALNNMGIAAAMSGHIKIAEAYFKKALNLDPNYQKTKQNLALLKKIKIRNARKDGK